MRAAGPPAVAGAGRPRGYLRRPRIDPDVARPLDGPLLLFGLLLLAGLSVPVVLLLNHRKAETVRAEERRATFRERLDGYFEGRRAARLDLDGLAAELGVSAGDAAAAAAEKYRELVDLALKDGRLTDRERARLHRIAGVLKVRGAERNAVERDAKLAVAAAAVDEILADGRVTEAESARLDALAGRLGLSPDLVQRHVADRAGEAFTRKIQGLMHRGRFTEADEAEVRRFRDAFGPGAAAATARLERDADRFVREFLTDLAEWDDVPADAAGDLARLARLLGLPPEQYRRHADRLAEIVETAAIRRGDLPSVPCPLELSGGEICHWFGRAAYAWRVASGPKSARGTLAVTSQRLIFNSDAKNFDLKAARIVRLEDAGRGAVHVTASVNSGGGLYTPDDWRQAERFAATLDGLVKKVNYRADRPEGAPPTRHIPDGVKQEVWHRDGGRCVRCGAEDYLEYDHVIPHSKGGANTVGNVQLLCRRCNGEKGDRI